MPEVKIFEIRDKRTCIPAMAIRLQPRDEAVRLRATNGPDVRADGDVQILLRAGWSMDQTAVYLVLLKGGASEYSPNRWDATKWGRTVSAAHHHIRECWHELASGSVVDIEHVLGETDKPKLPSWEEDF